MRSGQAFCAVCRKPNKLNEAFSIMIPGEPVFLAPGVRRILAGNPGLMTGAGTNTYLLGRCAKWRCSIRGPTTRNTCRAFWRPVDRPFAGSS